MNNVIRETGQSSNMEYCDAVHAGVVEDIDNRVYETLN